MTHHIQRQQIVAHSQGPNAGQANPGSATTAVINNVQQNETERTVRAYVRIVGDSTTKLISFNRDDTLQDFKATISQTYNIPVDSIREISAPNFPRLSIYGGDTPVSTFNLSGSSVIAVLTKRN